jgi:hypothetical protein
MKWDENHEDLPVTTRKVEWVIKYKLKLAFMLMQL